MLAKWFLRRRVVYPAVTVFCFGSLAPDFAQAQQRGEPAPRPPTQLAQAAGPPAYEEAKKEIDRFLAAAEATRKTIDRTNFDPAARAAAIGPKIQDLFVFVRDQIAYHPYQGVLRFAQGTLMSRAGNSCDKSLLLAAMLRHHGHKVRFARAKLDERMAEALVLFSDMPPAVDSRSSLGFETRAVLTDLLKRAGAPAAEIDEATREDDKRFEAFREALTKGAGYGVDELTLILKQAGIDFSGKTSTDAATLLATAKDHCWLQVETQGKWLDLDPSAYRIRLGARLAEPATVSDELPLELAFKLRFVVTVEKAEGDKVERVAVLDHTAPLLEAINQIRLGFVPENAARDNVVGFGNSAELTKFTVAWPVLIINEKRVAGDPFDLAGRNLARDPRQRLGDAIGRGFGGALGGARVSELRRVTLALTVTGPGGLAKSFERELARRATGPKEAVELNLRRQLIGSFDLVASGSRIDEAYVSAVSLDRLISGRQLWDHLLKVEHKLAKIEQLDRKALSAFGSGAEALNYLFIRSNFIEARSAIDAPTVIAFAAEPQIVVYRRKVLPGIDDKPSVSEGYDIFANSLRAYDDRFRSRETPLASASFRFEQGVIDTLLEYVLMGGGDATNVHSVLVAAQRRDGDSTLMLIRPGESAAVDRLQVDPAVKAAIRKDLQSGYVVVAPLKPAEVGGQPRYAWWRIHSETGDTLGVGANREGQGTVERILAEMGGAFVGCMPAIAYASDDSLMEAIAECVIAAIVFALVFEAFLRAALFLARRIKLLERTVAAARRARAEKAVTMPMPAPPRPRPSGRPLGRGGVWDGLRGPGHARPGAVPPPPPGVRPPRPPRSGQGDTTILDRIPWVR